METTIFYLPFQHHVLRDSFEAVSLKVQPARLWDIVISVHSARQWSERHVQRISSDPYFKALKGTYLHPTIPHILSLGIWLTSLGFVFISLLWTFFKLDLMLMKLLLWGIDFLFPTRTVQDPSPTAGKSLTEMLMKVKTFMFRKYKVENPGNLEVSAIVP